MCRPHTLKVTAHSVSLEPGVSLPGSVCLKKQRLPGREDPESLIPRDGVHVWTIGDGIFLV